MAEMVKKVGRSPMASCRAPIGVEKIPWPTFFTISAIVFAALVYGFFVIKKDDQEVGGDPFYTDKQLKAMKAAGAEVKA